ncbi:hypothetical protein [Leifsonia sp. Leaf264]|uniref:hypothetical protein n=1 Tax=Leifsonia sp. Leaf264 TaxID=1736314 RepID=UPI0006F70230|nr:hypothetical protein [Leifsonia sp. Leaf264]KQO98400.1 hypothetical protein ASF30_10085 [Leifsonia sp. Leaf264]
MEIFRRRSNRTPEDIVRNPDGSGQFYGVENSAAEVTVTADPFTTDFTALLKEKWWLEAGDDGQPDVESVIPGAAAVSVNIASSDPHMAKVTVTFPDLAIWDQIAASRGGDQDSPEAVLRGRLWVRENEQTIKKFFSRHGAELAGNIWSPSSVSVWNNLHITNGLSWEQVSKEMSGNTGVLWAQDILPDGKFADELEAYCADNGYDENLVPSLGKFYSIYEPRIENSVPTTVDESAASQYDPRQVWTVTVEGGRRKVTAGLHPGAAEYVITGKKWAHHSDSAWIERSPAS